MRSGNGRHRRPRQAPAVLVTAGVTGAGIAIPLLGASAASAADASTWDQVAECESGGLWSANKENGYYGGLQLTQEMWDEHGGSDYAERPDLASRGQQITVAEKILDARGPDAWPNCAEGAGLDEADADTDPGVDPGDLLTPAPERPDPLDPSAPYVPDAPGDGATDDNASPEDGSSDEATGGDSADDEADDDSADEADDASGDTSGADDVPDEPATPEPTPAPSDGATGEDGTPGGHEGDDGPSAGPAPDTTPGTGKHRGDQADEGDGAAGTDGTGGSGGADSGASEGGAADGGKDAEHPSRGGKHARPDAGHLVQPGESLSGIAAEHDVEGGWAGLYERNQDTVGSDPDLILPGQELAL